MLQPKKRKNLLFFKFQNRRKLTKTKHRMRTHGFLQRMHTRGGRAVLARRRLKQRKKLTV